VQNLLHTVTVQPELTIALVLASTMPNSLVLPDGCPDHFLVPLLKNMQRKPRSGKTTKGNGNKEKPRGHVTIMARSPLFPDAQSMAK
jgi:hypothetical protein